MPNYPQHSSIRKFFTKGQPLAFSKKEVILGNGGQPGGVYYIATGYVKLYSISNDGEEYVHVIYGQGELFPLSWAYLDEHPDPLFYEALSDCLLWRVSRYWFSHFVLSDVEASHAMATQLAHQFQILSDRLDNLEYKKAGERVAYRLLFLADRFGTKRSDGIIIDAPITHDLLASSINLARESVSREMERLEHEKIVKRVDHHIIITNIVRLTKQLSEPVNMRNWRFAPKSEN